MNLSLRRRWGKIDSRMFLLANDLYKVDLVWLNMSLSRHKVFPVCMIAFAASLSAETNVLDEQEGRIAALEHRITELEARLAEAEKLNDQSLHDAKTRIETLEAQFAKANRTAEVAEQTAMEKLSAEGYLVEQSNAVTQVPAAFIDDKLLWTDEKRWNEIKPGVTMEKVIELLGAPPRSLDSLKPRVDKVFFYQTNPKLSSYSLNGKISFRKGKVLAVEKPNFEQAGTGQH